ncbi:hypothetical protein RM697_00845 [Ichthyenterobacterium sp. W332]|uniref:Uncharacterized protein n=1 Tax=Microcosmobacter mediterraneus TaxID=3075607 RepID=A0ABU2YGK8_9FLAO|nr:hypothetical protein [Ichthyenterobacterium sp. W332]MDT0557172.1 hypothetical protein [Ichthyenterobacterium sp. W332]
MKTNFILLAILLIGVFSCSNDDSSEISNESQPNLTLNVNGVPEIILENVGGPVNGSNYEAGNTESAQIIATNNSNDITVTINLVDNDIDTQAIQSGNTLSIDNTQSNNVYATLTILDNTALYEASSGTVSISYYDLQSPNSNTIIISGSFNVTNGNNSASGGTFSDIELICSECGG